MKNAISFHILILILCLISLLSAKPLTDLSAVKALSDKTAKSNLPAHIEAVVIYSDPSKADTIIHDGTTACYIHVPPALAQPTGTASRPLAGDRVLFHAHTQLFGFAPHLEARSWEILGRGKIPEPRRLAAEEMYSPRNDTDWIEVPAVVIGVETGGLAYTLVVLVYGQIFMADIPNCPDASARAASLMQRPAMMRAVLGTVYNSQRQMTGRHFFVPSFDDIRPDAPAAAGGNVPLVTSLQLLSRNSSSTGLVRMEGVITQGDSMGFHLRDASASARIQAVMPERLPPGTRVSVEGYGVIAHYRPVLRATKVDRIADGPRPEPLEMTFPSSDSSLLQMELVKLEADILGSRSFQDETIFQCRANDTVFEAIMPRANQPPPAFFPGDRLQLTGICELTTTHPLPRPEWVNGFRVRLADSSSITLLHRAPWWTTERLLAALGAMTGLAVLGTLGTVFFGRAVRKQAHFIGEKIGYEAVSEERDRMARDLHDTLEQQLAGVALQLDGLDKMAKVDPSQIGPRLGLARRMLRYTRIEARRSVWDLRSKVLELQGLGTALRSMALGASSEDGPAVSFDIGELVRPLPNGSDFHLLRIAQEALANAIKHAAAREVLISLHETADSFVLTIRDDGRGFTPAPPHATVTSHFGILGMHERVEKINAAIDIRSSPGKGCTVTVTLPNP